MNNFCILVLSIMLSGCVSTASETTGNPDGIWTDMKTISGPSPVIKITPRFPEHLINRNLSGVVKMEFTIDSDGKPINIKILNDADQGLVSEAMQTLSRNRYSSKYSGDKVVVAAEFHLTSG